MTKEFLPIIRFAKDWRVYKRKQKQAMVLRSQKNLEYICDSLSTVHLLRSNEENVYQEVAAIFRRKQYRQTQERRVSRCLGIIVRATAVLVKLAWV